MLVECRQLLELPYLKKNITILSGENGLDNIVSWPFVVQTDSIAEWIIGGEILIVTGIGLKLDNENLIKLLEQARENLAAAFIILTSDNYISNVPSDFLALSNEYHIPVFQMPWETKILNVTKEISSYIVKNQLSNDSIHNILQKILLSEVDRNEINNRLAYYNKELSGKYQIIKMNFQNLPDQLERMQLADENKIMEYKNYIKQHIANRHAGIQNSFSMFYGDAIVLFLPQQSSKKEWLKKLLLNIAVNTAEKFKGIVFNIGVGMAYEDINDFKLSFSEAEKAVKLAKKTKTDNQLIFYEDLGLYRLIFEMNDRQEIQRYCDENLKPIVAYDKKHGTQLLETLEFYIDCNFNINEAAEKMFIHKNSFRYRLKKIEEITGKNLANANDLLNFHNSIVIQALMSNNTGKR
jgi:hypothetical protein